MNKLFLLVALLALYYHANGQSASPSVLNTSGRTVTAKNVQLSWSIGEFAIATLSAGGNIITEGFLQPDVVLKSSVDEFKINDIISCFPNPAHNDLYIRQSADVIGSVSIYNALGNRVYEQKFADGNINMSLWRPGFYFINITDRDGGEVHTFKIIKY